MSSMHGSGSPERDRVDEQLGHAREICDDGLSGENHYLGLLAIHLVEALVRQIRDLDDDVWHLKGALNSSTADNQIQIADIADAIRGLTTAVQAGGSRKKGGMFG